MIWCEEHQDLHKLMESNPARVHPVPEEKWLTLIIKAPLKGWYIYIRHQGNSQFLKLMGALGEKLARVRTWATLTRLESTYSGHVSVLEKGAVVWWTMFLLYHRIKCSGKPWVLLWHVPQCCRYTYTPFMATVFPNRVELCSLSSCKNNCSGMVWRARQVWKWQGKCEVCRNSSDLSLIKHLCDVMDKSGPWTYRTHRTCC